MDLVDRLAEIRRMQGREPMPDPSVIDGDPLPPPPLPENPDEDEAFLVPSTEPPPQWTQEPAVDYRRPRPEPEPSPPGNVAAESFVEFLNGKELIVHDTAAMYRSRAAELSPKERAAVVRIVLGAIRRILDEQYAEVAGPPRKRRSEGAASAGRAGGTTGPTVVPEAAAPLPRRRGRPPRQRLDGSNS